MMPKWVVFIGGAFAMLGALVVGVFIFTYFSSTRASCNAHSVMTLDSKEKTYRANLQTDNCSEDGSTRTVVNLSRFGDSLGATPTAWSAFIAPSAVEIAPSIYAPLQLEVQWLSDSELEISFPYNTKVLTRAGVNHGVSVLYRELNRP